MATPDDEPVLKARPRTNLGEIGTSGLLHARGILNEEFVRELAGQRGRRQFREMAENDPVIGSMLFSIEMLMRQVEWHVEPCYEDPNDENGYAAFVMSCLNDMEVPWSDTLSQILSMLVYGWSYHEIVYKVRAGNKPSTPQRDSKYDDNRIGWRKFAPRAQDTLLRWELSDNGDCLGMWQSAPPRYVPTYIPMEKALHFRTVATKNNPEGRSILRNAYRPWYFKRRMEEIEAIGIERDLAGLPVAWVPYTMLSSSATTEEQSALTEIKNIIRRIRRDEQEGVVFPMAFDPETGNKIFDLTLLSSGGNRQFDTSQIVTRYDQRIAMVVLADFVLLGHDKVGSFALGTSKIDLFTGALEAWMRMITSEINQGAIPRLLHINGMDVKYAPSLCHGSVKAIDLSVISDYLSKLAQAQMVKGSDALEEQLLTMAGLPYESTVLEDIASIPKLSDLPLPQPGNPQSATAAKTPGQNQPASAGGEARPGKPAGQPGPAAGTRQRVAPPTSYSPATRPPGSHS